MSGRIKTWVLATALTFAAASAMAGSGALELVTQPFRVGGETVAVRVPAGYRLELLDASLAGPRLLAFDAAGNLVVGSRSGALYRLAPPYDRATVLSQPGGYPHSVAFRDGELLVARTGGLFRAPYRPDQARIDEGAFELVARLPGGGGHSSRTVVVGPDGAAYVALGISGNCSDEYLGENYPFARRRGGVLRLDESAGRARLVPFASGLRNPVGLAFRPGSDELYATNNGPDHHGFEAPREHFSRVDAGSFHGMPWYVVAGGEVRRDPCIDSRPPRQAADVTLPVATFPARNAPLGVAFVPLDGDVDPRLAGDAIVALHGSWATLPDGGFAGDRATRRPPALVAVRFVDGAVRGVDDLVTGFQLTDGRRWARPAGVAVGPAGAIYFTSDAGIEGLFRLRRMPGE